MATQSLQILREALSKMADGDPRLTQQLELLVTLTKFTAFGQSTTEDTVLTSDGVTYAANVPVGRYFVDFVAMLNVVGGSPADGFVVEDASTATVAACSLAETAGDTSAVIMAAAPFGSQYAFSGADAVVSLRGFVEVQRAGVIGFRCRVEGSPTSVTLLAGSGLTTTIVRVAP